MKSLDELNKLKTSAQAKLKGKQGAWRVCVGMGTCGIAAGAEPILDAFSSEIKNNSLKGVFVAKVGCKGQCVIEPMADVIDSSGKSITYCKLTPNKVSEIVRKHIIGGHIVQEYTYSK